MSSDVIAKISQLDAAVCAVVCVWQRVLELVMGAILAPGKRTVSAILRVMGLHEQHELLPSAESGGLVCRKASQILLRHLIVVFAPTGVLVMGLDDTIERREGSELPPRGSIVTQFARDSHLVKASGLRG